MIDSGANVSQLDQALGTKAGGRVLVIVEDCADPEPVLAQAASLAERLGVPLSAIHIETPDSAGSEDQTVAALARAAAFGAAVASVPATSVVEGVAAHLDDARVEYLFVGVPPTRPTWLRGAPSLVEKLLKRGLEKPIVVIPCLAVTSPARKPPWKTAAVGPRAYLSAITAVAATIPVLLLLARLMGAQALSLLFLFPVITVAARYGFLPGALATTMSVLAYNFFLLRPIYRFTLASPQNLLMAVTLLGLSAYTSWLTTKLRARVRLSDRSAEVNAAIAGFGLSLTKASNWETTAEIVARDISMLLDVRSAVFREVEGELVAAGWFPEAPSLGPVDVAALEWAWDHGQESGSGTENIAAADWQFQPLATQLGVLAVLALARPDGRDPVRAENKVLLTTLVTQAALAHERLRLESLAR